MGYYLNAFIGSIENLEAITLRFKNAKTVLLTNQLAIFPMTSDLFNEINDYRASSNIGKYLFLTSDIENEILRTIGDRSVAYIELEYFGGSGVQKGIVWKNGKRISEYNELNAVNSILRQFGIARTKTKDEFETIGLNRHRNTEDWLDGFN